MAYNGCFDSLKGMANTANNVRFNNDARLKQMFEMIVAGDKNRLQSLEYRRQEALARGNKLQTEADEVRQMLDNMEKGLRFVQQKCEGTQNKKNVPKVTKDKIAERQEQIKQMLKIFQMYKAFTSVRFSYKHYPKRVSGCIAVKGDKPAKSVLRPFNIEKPESSTGQEIWDEMSKAADTLNKE